VPERSKASSHEQLYLVERYWPGVDEDGLRELLPRLEREASAISAAGHPVSHVGSLLVPDDQVVFSVILADSVEVVLEVNERAGLPVDRVAPVTTHGFRTGAPEKGDAG
jgi:hypothetical protein